MREKNYRVIKILKSMGSPIRFQICRLLIEHDEMNVSELAEKIGCSQNQTSQHLRNLKNVDLVHYRHEGTYICYRLKKPDIVRRILDLADELSRQEDSEESEEFS
ncbi:MAG: ArsR/SmtB family transcription factor [bacterium]